MKKKIKVAAVTAALTIIASISVGCGMGKQPEGLSVQENDTKQSESFYAQENNLGNASKNDNKNEGKTRLFQWGKTLRERTDLADDEISLEDVVMVGEDVLITKSELDQAVKFYEIGGYDTEEAKKMAETYVKEENALYAEALKNGYSATDEEVYAYLEELKKALAEDEDVAAVIDGYGSEDAYWEYLFTVYQKQLPIQNYVSDQQDAYKTKVEGRSGSWEDEFASLKNRLVQEQNFRTIDQVEEIPEKFNVE